MGGNTDAPASDNTLGAMFECKHAWLERKRQHLGILSFEGTLILLASSLKKATSDSKREPIPKGTLSAATQKTDVKPKNFGRDHGSRFPSFLQGRGVGQRETL